MVHVIPPIIIDVRLQLFYADFLRRMKSDLTKSDTGETLSVHILLVILMYERKGTV